MATINRINEALTSDRMGDVEKYFSSITNLIDANSGVNDFRMISSDCYNSSCPVTAQQFTFFHLTDPSCDIIDISKGFITLDLTMDVQFMYRNAKTTTVHENGEDSCVFFIGFKSASHIIDVYNIYSNGRLTNCKQTKAKHEQMVSFNCKSKEQKIGRPGMYSVPKNVLKMRNCVCGVYVQLPNDIGATGESSNNYVHDLEVLIQIDDLLPFSAMEYFPRFACGNLEIEMSFNLDNNMVFCQIPLEEVMRNQTYGSTKPELHNEFISSEREGLTDTSKYRSTTVLNTYSQLSFNYDNNKLLDRPFDAYAITNSKFTQCKDYARGMLGIHPTSTATAELPETNVVNADSVKGGYSDCYYTIEPSNLRITDAKSHVFGFNIKSQTKANILKIFENDGRMIIPAQWADQQTLPQVATATGISANAPISLWECEQLIVTFPNSDNQLTVSRNPFIDNIKVQLGSKLIPDKVMNTYSPETCEMTLTALKLDSLFAASDSLIKSLVPRDHKNNVFVMNREDDSDYMFVVDLERNGSGSYCDGVTGSNIALQIDGTFHHGNANPHFYEYDASKDVADRFPLRSFAPSVVAVSDAFWTFGPNGGEFIKDSSTIGLTEELSARRKAEYEQLKQVTIQKAMDSIPSNLNNRNRIAAENNARRAASNYAMKEYLANNDY